MNILEMEIYGFNKWGQPYGGPPRPKKKGDQLLELRTDELGQLISVRKIIVDDQAAIDNKE
jgi:hypothetical protein